ncbi:hypothetical protein BC827DRAFT_876459 [Russula dissimulans]|nr:hypothetical protein BC827DRAFT_876459 [Russula dissimulans]
MHASNIAFLLLAASAAAPALAAPLSARMPAGVPAAADIATRDATSSLDDANAQLLRTLLTSRSENDAPSTMSDIDAFKILFGRGGQGEVPDALAARNEVDDFITLLGLSGRDAGLNEPQPRFSFSELLAGLEAVAGSILRRDVPDALAARSEVNDFITLLGLSGRDAGLNEPQPRFSFSELVAGLEAMAGSILRRDVPDALAARSEVNDFITLLGLSGRDAGLNEPQPRFSFSELVAGLEAVAGSILRRDVPDALAARSEVNDFITLLGLSGRDAGLNEPQPRFSFSELVAGLEAMAGSILRRDVPDALAARSEVNDFITLLGLSGREAGLNEPQPRFSFSELVEGLEAVAGSILRRDDLD